VESPGGEGLASDLIGHQVEVTAQELPVVVSMVDVAASGGYHVSYRATKIVADPLTVTGSIGSISGKFNVKELHSKLGITHDFVVKGPSALFWSDQRNFTDEEWDRFTEHHWETFNDWLRDVAEHRELSFEEAEMLAHGRVWTGRQALENGLVDEVGGLDRAIEVARELAEIPEDEKVTIVHYPERKGLLETILSGDLSFTTAVRWGIYRIIREDLAETWEMLTGRRPIDLFEFSFD
jgi:protease-4